MKYLVKWSERFVTQVVVEADSAEEAIEKAKEEEYEQVLYSEDYVDTDEDSYEAELDTWVDI